MASLPVLTVLEQTKVSPPAATVGEKVLPLTYFDFVWLTLHPIHYLFFYDDLSITQTQFTQTIIPKLKQSLSITLQHFSPFAGNLFVYPTPTRKPEIRYVEGDSVTVTFAESNLDFNELTGNHPRDCGMFYDLIPQLGEADNTTDFTKISVFSVQVTLFPNSGISIGMTNHHGLADASTRYYFLKAWTSIARFGTDELFLANGTLPIYDRLVKNPKLDENYLNLLKVETFKDEYPPPKLCSPTDKVRATFILPRSVLNRLKILVSTQVETLAYVSTFTVACAYIWSCMAKAREEGLQAFCLIIDCRARMKPAIPEAYFGNCVGGSMAMENASKLTGKDGFVTAAKLIGESLHKTLTDKDGIVKEIQDSMSIEDRFPNGIPTTLIGIAGTPKLKFYQVMDFGWGKPKKIETVSIDYNEAISMNAGNENDQDVEIGVCLPVTVMESFVRAFKDGLDLYV